MEPQAIETALATVYALMTGDLARRASSRVTSTTGTIHGDVERAGNVRIG